MGLGAVCHTLNPRLYAADLEYIINHGAGLAVISSSSQAATFRQAIYDSLGERCGMSKSGFCCPPAAAKNKNKNNGADV